MIAELMYNAMLEYNDVIAIKNKTLVKTYKQLNYAISKKVNGL